MDWTYGDAGDRFPMKRGEVWCIDGSLFAVGDLERGDLRPFVEFAAASGCAPTALYSDPPWDKGNARSFRTKAFGKAESRPVDFMGSLIPRVLDACALVSGPCAIEMGLKHMGVVCDMAAKLFGNITVSSITYYKKNPCWLLLFHSGVGAVPDPTLFDGQDDELTPGIFLDSLPRTAVVLDPCAGRGLTPFSASSRGRGSVSMELNPRRLSCAIDSISKHRGAKPELAGNFTKRGV